MSARPREVVLAYYAAVDSGDTDGLVALFHPDAEYRRGGYLPIRGTRELRHFYEKVRIIGAGRHRVLSVVADGDEVAARGCFDGTSRDGSPLSADWADFFTVNNGLIRFRFTYFMAPGV